MNLDTIIERLNALLRVDELPDYPTALNGLQVQNSGEVTRVGAAVDLSEATIRAAIERRCDLLLVHHGLFWDGLGRITGRRYNRLKLLIENNIAVYAAHLPLDVHPQVGNNALLAGALGLSVRGTFGSYQGMPLGICGTVDVSRDVLCKRLEDLLGGPVKLIPGGPDHIRSVGVITGGAGSMIGDAVSAQLDAFITGEGNHHTYFDAMEFGVNVFYGGHYATETFGVRALGKWVSDEFDLPWEFFDLPTGL